MDITTQDKYVWACSLASTKARSSWPASNLPWAAHRASGLPEGSAGSLLPVPLTAGSLSLATGTAMIIRLRRAFQAAGTPIRPFTESTGLICHGLYRWSRNPVYLGTVLLAAGVAILLGTLAPLLVVIVVFAILQEGFIRREERLLEDTFGDRYRAYLRSVRRWL